MRNRSSNVNIMQNMHGWAWLGAYGLKEESDVSVCHERDTLVNGTGVTKLDFMH